MFTVLRFDFTVVFQVCSGYVCRNEFISATKPGDVGINVDKTIRLAVAYSIQ